MKRILATLMLSLALSFGIGGMTTVSAASTDAAKSAACEGVNVATASCGDTSGVQKAISAITNILSIIVGIAAFIMIVIAGLKYTTSGGDSSSVASAKNTLIYALVGLVIAALAQVIVRFVLFETTQP